MSVYILVVVMACLHTGAGSLALPPGWTDAPDKLEDFRDGGLYVIDPWRYSQRLGAYKIMLQQTAFAMKTYGANNSGNILWGLPLQFGWQLSTQRTRDLANLSTCGFPPHQECLSCRSWWASVNYYLSIVPFLGMVKAGYFTVPPSTIHIKPAENDPGLYCTDVDSCYALNPDVVNHWADFFALLKNDTVRNGLNRFELLDKYIAAMWRAHLQSISTALPLFKGRQSWMSTEEESFGVNWANLVSFIAATHFPTDNRNTSINQIEYLPRRLLWASDNPPRVPGLTANQNKALIVLNMFDRLNSYSGGYLLSIWEKSMCTPEARQIGRVLLENIIPRPWSGIMDFLRLVKLALTSTC